LNKLGIARATFYRWYDLCRLDGIDALEDHRPIPRHVWNRITDRVRREIVDLALDIPERSLRKLARELPTKAVEPRADLSGVGEHVTPKNNSKS
jgi:hypothetical protein